LPTIERNPCVSVGIVALCDGEHTPTGLPAILHAMDINTNSGAGVWFHLAQGARFFFWLLLIVFLLLQLVSFGDTTQKKRNVLLDRFQAERKSRVIALIHRQESQSILGVPVSSHIDIEDSEAVLRAIRLTPDEQPIDLILHTPGASFSLPSRSRKRWSSTKAR
jgi:hypothetical protein